MTEIEKDIRENIKKLNDRLYELLQRYQGDPPPKELYTLETIYDALAVEYRRLVKFTETG